VRSAPQYEGAPHRPLVYGDELVELGGRALDRELAAGRERAPHQAAMVLVHGAEQVARVERPGDRAGERDAVEAARGGRVGIAQQRVEDDEAGDHALPRAPGGVLRPEGFEGRVGAGAGRAAVLGTRGTTRLVPATIRSGRSMPLA
jgi:hypothetical protein